MPSIGHAFVSFARYPAHMLSPALWFSIATLGPAALIASGLVLGGLWAFAGLLSMTVVIFVLDRRLPKSKAPQADTGLTLPAILAITHALLLALIAWRASSLSLTEAALTLTAAGLWLGQVSNSNAHELIHQPPRWARRTGRALYASLFFGHHASAHVLVHHVHAGTPNDPNTAPLGLNVWRFLPAAWIGSYRAGWQAETRRRPGQSTLRHPYIFNGLISVLTLISAALIGGWPGATALLCVALYAQMQLLLSDYVQHYGLLRDKRPDGSYAPLTTRHSWNAPYRASSALMLNAPRHSDHHVNPRKPFATLTITDDMPTLPHALPVMAVIALIPPLWHRLMDHRAARWQTPEPAPIPQQIAAE